MFHYLVYLNGTESESIRIIIGFIEVDNRIHDYLADSVASITSREKEVFRYLAEGCSSKMIADYLSISETTVITHRKNLIQKLQVKNSAELIKKGFEFKLHQLYSYNRPTPHKSRTRVLEDLS